MGADEAIKEMKLSSKELSTLNLLLSDAIKIFSQDEILKKRFDDLDKDKSGYLELNEVKEMISASYKEYEDFLNNLIRNSTGMERITYDLELKKYLSKRDAEVKDRLIYLLQKFDENNDQKFSFSEMKNYWNKTEADYIFMKYEEKEGELKTIATKFNFFITQFYERNKVEDLQMKMNDYFKDCKNLREIEQKIVKKSEKMEDVKQVDLEKPIWNFQYIYGEYLYLMEKTHYTHFGFASVVQDIKDYYNKCKEFILISERLIKLYGDKKEEGK